jgi:hypothetical protein
MDILTKFILEKRITHDGVKERPDVYVTNRLHDRLDYLARKHDNDRKAIAQWLKEVKQKSKEICAKYNVSQSDCHKGTKEAIKYVKERYGKGRGK